MDFDLLNSCPEAELELMNKILELEQLTALTDHAVVVPTTPTSPIQTPRLSPVSHMSSTSANYHDQYVLPATYAANHCPDYMASPGGAGGGGDCPPGSPAAMREMIFHIAALQPVNIDPEMVRPPKRRNVRISKDPQSVAARLRRERISERIRILQRLVPGGTKMDTASMLDEAIHYVKFLKSQVQSLERAAAASGHRAAAAVVGLGVAYPGLNVPW